MIGSVAPNFCLIDQDGKEFELYKNPDSKIMLVFYPKDETSVCTKQLCEYNDNLIRFSEFSIKVVAINIGNTKSHKSFAENHGYKFPILDDSQHEVSNLYGAINIFGFNKRKIVVIDENKKNNTRRCCISDVIPKGKFYFKSIKQSRLSSLFFPI